MSKQVWRDKIENICRRPGFSPAKPLIHQHFAWLKPGLHHEVGCVAQPRTRFSGAAKVYRGRLKTGSGCFQTAFTFWEMRRFVMKQGTRASPWGDTPSGRFGGAVRRKAVGKTGVAVFQTASAVLENTPICYAAGNACVVSGRHTLRQVQGFSCRQRARLGLRLVGSGVFRRPRGCRCRRSRARPAA